MPSLLEILFRGNPLERPPGPARGTGRRAMRPAGSGWLGAPGRVPSGRKAGRRALTPRERAMRGRRANVRRMLGKTPH